MSEEMQRCRERERESAKGERGRKREESKGRRREKKERQILEMENSERWKAEEE